MNKLIVCVLSLCSLFLPVICYSQLSSGELSIGGLYYNDAYAIVQTADGGYIAAGINDNGSNDDVYVSRLDANGNLKWAKNIGGSTPTLNDVAYSIIQTKDGNLLLTGYTMTYASTWANVYLIKMDTSGNVEWTKSYFRSGFDYGTSIIETKDGGYAITGYSLDSKHTGGYHVYVLKVDTAGNVKWGKTIGGDTAEYGYSIIQTHDGGFAIAGYTTSYGAGGEDIYVVKLDSVGNLKWDKAIGGTGNEKANSIIETKDGGLAVVGTTTSYGAGQNDVYVVKLDSAGGLKWTRTVGGTYDDEGSSIIQNADGSYIITGYTGSYGAGGYDLYLIKLDSTGNLRWTKARGGSFGEFGYSSVKTKDKGIAIGGSQASYSWDKNAYVYFVKLDTSYTFCSPVDTGGIAGSGGIETNGSSIDSSSFQVINLFTSGQYANGSLTSICQVLTSAVNVNPLPNKISVYPNPSNGTFNFVIAGEAWQSHPIIEVYNLLGEKIYSQFKINNSEFTIDLSGQPNGIYFYRVLSQNETLLGKGKLIIQK